MVQEQTVRHLYEEVTKLRKQITEPLQEKNRKKSIKQADKRTWNRESVGKAREQLAAANQGVFGARVKAGATTQAPIQLPD